ncbi:FAD/NAD(P)-binding domain-containing protein [Atractiella rhizophila]|nr:FAD/NAD(P)-binding domain-containing protein [Atractiella rhizophila]
MHFPLFAASVLRIACALPQQQYIFSSGAEDDFYHFPTAINRVAVIGAGVSGLQAASTLLKHNFTVRLFDRGSDPGGNWNYQPFLRPVREEYPQKKLIERGYERDIPEELPTKKIWREGDGGWTLGDRWRDHVWPSPVWEGLHTNSPSVITQMPDVPYPKDHSWVLHQSHIHSHVRSYAAFHSLSSNDLPPYPYTRAVHSYNTRVESLHKGNTTWSLLLRKLTWVQDGKALQANYWEEEFDAVVVATGAYDSSYLPDIDGLKEWWSVKDSEGRWKVWHSRNYRRPQELTGKNVLIVGGSVSGSEIALELAPHVKNLYASIRPHENLTPFARRSLRRFPNSTIHFPAISSFSPLPLSASSAGSLRQGKITFVDGRTLEGIDEVILATGYRRSNPFLREYHNSTIAQSGSKTAPILTDGKSLHSLSWNGFYIPDPSLVFTNVRPWTIGRYQTVAIAKVFEGTAFLPSTAKLWKEYSGPQGGLRGAYNGVHASPGSERAIRRYVSWLNYESEKYGGRFVEPLPIEEREIFVYYANQEWEEDYVSLGNFTQAERKQAIHSGRNEEFWSAVEESEAEW